MYQSGSKELDYIRPELTHRNEQWVECSIAEVHRDITEKIQGSHRTRITEESYPNPGRGNSNQARNHHAGTPAIRCGLQGTFRY